MTSHAMPYAREDGEDAAAAWQSCVLHPGWEEASGGSTQLTAAVTPGGLPHLMNERKRQGAEAHR